MKQKKKISSFILIIAILFSILYIFLAPKPLTKEYQFTPFWQTSIQTTPTPSESPSAEKLCFKLGKTLGYFSPSGKINLYQSFSDKASISDKYYAVYNTTSANIPFYNSEGKLAGQIKAAGYPFFVNDLIFVFLPGGSSFAKCNETGDIVWRYDGTIPITAFSAKKNFIAVGFADGSIKVFQTANGNCDINFVPGGSDYPVILGIDITDDGNYIASISGHETQRFVLTHREDTQTKIIHHTFIDDGMPYRTQVHFTSDGKQVFYSYQGKLGIFNLEKQEENIISIKPRIISIEETDNLIFVLGHEKNNYTVYAIEKTNKLQGSFTFQAETAFIQASNNRLYVGKDNTISCIQVTRE